MTIALVEHGRRAVYHALGLVLPDRETLLRAFAVWEQSFADPPGLRVTLYVTTLVKAELLEDEKVGALSAALYAAMILPEEKLPPLPVEARDTATRVVAADKTSVSQPPLANSHLAIFSSLMAALVEDVRRMRKFDAFVAALQTQEPELSEATMRARGAWIEGPLTSLSQFAASVPPSERRPVLSDMYLALRAVCGQADADAVVATAVGATERIADPRRSTRQRLSRV